MVLMKPSAKFLCTSPMTLELTRGDRKMQVCPSPSTLSFPPDCVSSLTQLKPGFESLDPYSQFTLTHSSHSLTVHTYSPYSQFRLIHSSHWLTVHTHSLHLLIVHTYSQFTLTVHTHSSHLLTIHTHSSQCCPGPVCIHPFPPSSENLLQSFLSRYLPLFLFSF